MEQKSSLYGLFVLDSSEAGQRLDHVLASRFDLSRKEFRNLASQGRIRINGRALICGAPRQKAGDEVEILAQDAEPAILPEKIPLEVLYETEKLMVVNKPPKMAMYPGPKRPAGTVANALRGMGRSLSGCEGPFRPGIVHRLDAGTSGALLVAKDDQTHRQLVALLSQHAIHRGYLALVHGRPDWEKKESRAPIGPKRPGRKGMRVFAHGKSAHTRFELMARGPEHSLVEAWPQTGRTHQIRVHLSQLGLPIVGDTLYGGGSSAVYPASRLGIDHTALHSLKLQHEALGIDVTAPLPQELTEAIRKAGIGWSINFPCISGK